MLARLKDIKGGSKLSLKFVLVKLHGKCSVNVQKEDIQGHITYVKYDLF